MDYFVGQRVICVDASGKTDLVKGQEYTIQARRQAPCCGRLLISVGSVNIYVRTRCAKCGGTYDITEDAYVHYRAERFIPVQEFKTVTYTKILESIPAGAQ